MFCGAALSSMPDKAIMFPSLPFEWQSGSVVKKALHGLVHCEQCPAGCCLWSFECFGNQILVGSWLDFPCCDYSAKQFLDISHLTFATKEAYSVQWQESCLSVRKRNTDYWWFCCPVSRIDFCGWEQHEERSWEPGAAIQALTRSVWKPCQCAV